MQRPARERVVARAAHTLATVARVLRRLLGAPDYERYLAHVQARGEGAPAMSREEFMRARLAQRYDRPGSRCC